MNHAGSSRTRNQKIQNFLRFIIPLLPLICGLLGASVALLVLGVLGPLDLKPSPRWILWRTAPLHYAAASFVVLLMIQVAIVAACFLTLRSLRIDAAMECPLTGGKASGNFFLWTWVAVYAVAHGIFCAMREWTHEAVHPVLSLGKGFLRIALESPGHVTKLCEHLEHMRAALLIIEFMTFASIAGLVTTVCALVCLARNASMAQGGYYRQYLARERKIARAIRWLMYQIMAGGLMLAVNVWNHHTWTTMSLWRLKEHPTKHLRDSIESLVAFHATMHVILLLVIALPALLIVRESAFRYARRRNHGLAHGELHKWMDQHGLRFNTTGLAPSAISILLPLIVSEALKLF